MTTIPTIIAALAKLNAMPEGKSILVDRNGGYNSFSILAKNKDGVVTSCYLSPKYTVLETFEFLLEQGFSFNLSYAEIQAFYWAEFVEIEKIINDEYESWLEWIEDGKAQGYNMSGNFFQSSWQTPELWSLVDVLYDLGYTLKEPTEEDLEYDRAYQRIVEKGIVHDLLEVDDDDDFFEEFEDVNLESYSYDLDDLYDDDEFDKAFYEVVNKFGVYVEDDLMCKLVASELAALRGDIDTSNDLMDPVAWFFVMHTDELSANVGEAYVKKARRIAGKKFKMEVR